jgi:hypothetical protein
MSDRTIKHCDFMSRLGKPLNLTPFQKDNYSYKNNNAFFTSFHIIFTENRNTLKARSSVLWNKKTPTDTEQLILRDMALRVIHIGPTLQRR